MNTTIKINAQDINENIMRSIKAMFGNKEIEINISEALDDTDYLFRSVTNKKLLEERMKNADEGKNLVNVPIENLKKMAEDE
ncbi:MAG: hypothetical protein KAT68_09210 [Bacteroidales bacterium]|nr:hypothetical protein [Bacteroidales bacterium]